MLTRFYELGPLQIAVMKALWRRGPSSVFEVMGLLPQISEKTYAYTTVLTVLRNLEVRGLVGHEVCEGRRNFVYFSKFPQEEARRLAVEELMNDLFEHSSPLFCHYLIQEYPLEQEEISELQESLEMRASNPSGN